MLKTCRQVFVGVRDLEYRALASVLRLKPFEFKIFLSCFGFNVCMQRAAIGFCSVHAGR